MAVTMKTPKGTFAHYDKYERVESGMTWPCVIFMICVLIPIMLLMCPVRAGSALWGFIKDELTIFRTRGRVVTFPWEDE